MVQILGASSILDVTPVHCHPVILALAHAVHSPSIASVHHSIELRSRLQSEL